MYPLFSTIGNGTVQVWEAVALMAAAMVHASPPRAKRRAAQLYSRTLRTSAWNWVPLFPVSILETP
jgi:hypothetical protein